MSGHKGLNCSSFSQNLNNKECPSQTPVIVCESDALSKKTVNKSQNAGLGVNNDGFKSYSTMVFTINNCRTLCNVVSYEYIVFITLSSEQF